MALDLAMRSLRWRSLIRWHENSIEVAVLDLVADERGTLVAATGVTWRRGVVTGGGRRLGVEAANGVDPECRAPTTATLSSRRRAHGKVLRVSLL
jgi:hypothetical protein